jgi:hypothetical protein
MFKFNIAMFMPEISRRKFIGTALGLGLSGIALEELIGPSIISKSLEEANRRAELERLERERKMKDFKENYPLVLDSIGEVKSVERSSVSIYDDGIGKDFSLKFSNENLIAVPTSSTTNDHILNLGEIASAFDITDVSFRYYNIRDFIRKGDSIRYVAIRGVEPYEYIPVLLDINNDKPFVKRERHKGYYKGIKEDFWIGNVVKIDDKKVPIGNYRSLLEVRNFDDEKWYLVVKDPEVTNRERRNAGAATGFWIGFLAGTSLSDKDPLFYGLFGGLAGAMMLEEAYKLPKEVVEKAKNLINSRLKYIKDLEEVLKKDSMIEYEVYHKLGRLYSLKPI